MRLCRLGCGRRDGEKKKKKQREREDAWVRAAPLFHSRPGSRADAIAKKKKPHKAAASAVSARERGRKAEGTGRKKKNQGGGGEFIEPLGRLHKYGLVRPLAHVCEIRGHCFLLLSPITHPCFSSQAFAATIANPNTRLYIFKWD